MRFDGEHITYEVVLSKTLSWNLDPNTKLTGNRKNRSTLNYTAARYIACGSL
jgi:hypothetical protein